MMSRSATARSNGQLVRGIAHRYERRGYRVIVKPKGPDLPDFLAHCSPDLLAVGDDESVVVQVESRQSAAHSDKLVRLAEAIEDRPNWRFEFVMANLDDPESTNGTAYLSRGDLEATLETARDLTQRGNQQDALLLLWRAVEGALRLIARQEQVSIEQMNPAAIVGHLSTLGLIERADYQVLQTAIRIRNALVHGFSSEDLTPELLDRLAHITENLLGEPTRRD